MNKLSADTLRVKLTTDLLQSIRRDAAEELKHHVFGGPLPVSSTLGIINKIKALHRVMFENEVLSHVCGENLMVAMTKPYEMSPSLQTLRTLILSDTKAKAGKKTKPAVKLGKTAKPVVVQYFPDRGQFLATLPDGRTFSNTRVRDLTKRLKDLGYEVKMVT